MKLSAVGLLAALAAAVLPGCGRPKPAPKPARRAATRPAPATAPAPTRPAATQAAATQPAPATRPATTPAVGFDEALAHVLSLAEKTEFFEAMKACRDMRRDFPGHPRANELSALMRRLKEYRRDSAGLADALRKLTSPMPESRRLAGRTLTRAGPLGAIYLRKALRDGPAEARVEAARLLVALRDAKSPPLLLAALRAGAKPPARSALMSALAGLIDQTDPAVFREAHARVVAEPTADRLEWLDYLAAVLRHRCGRSADRFDALLAAPGAHGKLKGIVLEALATGAGSPLAPGPGVIAAFGAALGYEDCVLWLRADVDVTADADGLVSAWGDLSAAGREARQEALAKRPTLARDAPGGAPAIRFDGAGDCLVLPAGFADLRGGLTVTVWACPTRVRTWGRFIDFGNGGGVDNLVFSRHEKSDRLAFQLYVGKAQGMVTSKDALETGRWQHLAATQDPNGQVVLYKGGQPIATGKMPPAARAVVRKSNFIARSNWGGTDEFYEGYLREIRLYKRALSADEVRTIHARTRRP